MIYKIQKEKGAAAVEFAIILPILIVIAFGIVYFGPAFNNYIAVNHAARDGARLLAVKAKFDANGNLDSNGTFTEGRLIKNIENNLPDYVKDEKYWGSLENINITINNSEPNVIGAEASVLISGDVILNIPFVANNKVITISKEVVMRQEQ